MKSTRKPSAKRAAAEPGLGPGATVVHEPGAPARPTPSLAEGLGQVPAHAPESTQYRNSPRSGRLMLALYDTNREHHLFSRCGACQARAAQIARADGRSVVSEADKAQALQEHVSSNRNLADISEFSIQAERWAQDYSAPAPVGVDAVSQIAPAIRAHVNAARQARGDPNLKLDVLATFAHGYVDRLHLGGRLGRGQLARFLGGISDLLAPDITVANYACSTGGSRGDGEMSFSDVMHDQLVALGHDQAEVMGHIGGGHATARPELRVFSGPQTEGGAPSLRSLVLTPEFVQSQLDAFDADSGAPWRRNFLRGQLNLFFTRAMVGDRARDFVMMAPQQREALIRQVRQQEWPGSEEHQAATERLRPER